MAVTDVTGVTPPEVQPIFDLDLDYDLLCHLAVPESVHYLRGEHVSLSLIEDDDIREVMEWQFDHCRQHGQAATGTVLEAEFSEIELSAPQTAIGDLIDRLRDRHVRNDGRQVIEYLAGLAVTDPGQVAREMLKEGRRLADATSKRGEIFGTGDYERGLDAYHKRVARGRGPSLGFREIDDHFNGMIGVTILLAPPKTYKSWYTIQGVKENIYGGNRPYLYSLELPALESDWRLRCAAADVPYWKYLKGALTPTDEQALKIASQNLDAMGTYRVEKPEQGQRSVERVVERALSWGADSIWIDQLQYLETRKGVNLGAANNTGDYFEVVNDLRNWSDHIPIFLVHQFNRSVMNSSGLPEMQQGKGSSAMEEVATLMLGLWASKDMRKSNLVEIGTLASRNYSYASWELGVELSKGCRLEMNGRSDLDDDDDE